MKKVYTLLTLLIAVCQISFSQQVYTGTDASSLVSGAQSVTLKEGNSIPSFIIFRSEKQIPVIQILPWFKSTFKLNSNVDFKLLNIEKDNLGMQHYRYQETVNGNAVQGTMYIFHVKNNLVVSMNGLFFANLSTVPAAATLSESTALSMAINYVGASIYRWQSSIHENQLKEATDNPNATWFPKGELVFAPVGFNYSANNFRLAYVFDIYADMPLSRKLIYVDAITGEIILTLDKIENTDTPATAITAYSGSQTIITDSFAGGYRLQEVAHGGGIRTYNNLLAANATGTTDFVNATTTWNNVNAQLDQYATDAHWGAEKTWDYYDSTFNRNSVDDAGQPLLSYVHVDVNLVNAFWDGTEMNYGDGDATYNPLTCLDVAGHEITHGVTQFTSNLNYQAESGALNESFSDCMGNSVRQFARHSAVMDWLIGDEMGGTPFRSMADPNLYGDPDTYFGNNWASLTGGDNGGVHTNSGVMNYWYYLLAEGGSGTNDNAFAYNIPAIGLDKAQQICYRAQAVYNTTTTGYMEMRANSIQAAIDLYGACSNEVQVVTNAWQAVGVGNGFSIGVTAAFSVSPSSTCNLNTPIQFSNQSINAGIFHWYFGDGGTSTLNSPSHTYAGNGVYDVKLVSDGGTCGIDSITVVGAVTVNAPLAPVTTGDTSCTPQIFNLAATGSNLYWYDAAVGGNFITQGNNYTTPLLSSTVTYYVEDHSSNPVQSVGPLDNTIGAGGNYNNADRFQVFDAIQPFTLISVKVYSTGAGNRTFRLMDAAGTILHDTIINVPNAPSPTGTVVTLNFQIPQGTGLQLGCLANSNLYRNSAGASYPYDIAGVCSITGNSVPDPARWYFVYDWQIKPADCIGPRTPVTAIVGSGATITASPAGPFNVCEGTPITLSASGNGPWQWGGASSATTQSINVSSSGSYTVSTFDSICSVTINSNTVNVVIHPQPVASFTSTGNPTVVFTNTTTNGNNYQWNFGDGGGSTIMNPTHTYTANGTYTVTLISCNAQCCDTTTFDVMISGLGVTDVNASTLVLFPNPTTGNLVLKNYKAHNGDMITFTDVLGRIVLEKTATGSFDISDFAAGVYMVKLTTANGTMTGKIVKQ